MEYSDDLMLEAFQEAKRALDVGEVPVGAIFYEIESKKIVARGCNSVNATKNATRHAEFNCIDQIVAGMDRSKPVQIVLFASLF